LSAKSKTSCADNLLSCGSVTEICHRGRVLWSPSPAVLSPGATIRPPERRAQGQRYSSALALVRDGKTGMPPSFRHAGPGKAGATASSPRSRGEMLAKSGDGSSDGLRPSRRRLRHRSEFRDLAELLSVMHGFPTAIRKPPSSVSAS